MTYPDSCLIWAKLIGIALGKMHDADIVHGDLTTSNILVCEEEEEVEGGGEESSSSSSSSLAKRYKVVLIDFGLGSMQSVIEDKAVDLYVLERAFLATHPGSDGLVAAIIESYRFSCALGTKVLSKLEQVRMRGRKRECFG